MFLNSKPFYIKTPLTEEEVRTRLKALFKANQRKQVEDVDDYPYGGYVLKNKIQLFRVPLYFTVRPFNSNNLNYVYDYSFCAITMELYFNKISEGILEGKFLTTAMQFYFILSFLFFVLFVGFVYFTSSSPYLVLLYSPLFLLLGIKYYLQNDHIEQMKIEISIFFEGEIVETPSSEV